MKALVLKTVETLEVMDVPMPKLQTGTVMVKVSRCGVCGSDVRYFHGENPWAKQTLQQEIPNPPNIILGHEHPAITVSGGVASHVKCPCFVAGTGVLVLPAFSRWAAGSESGK